MKKSDFMNACDKAGCTLRYGKVMFGDIELGTYTELGFDVTASVVDLNTFKVLLNDTIHSLFSSVGGTKDAKKD